MQRTRMNLRSIRLRRQTQKNTDYYFIYIKYQTSQETTVTESRSVVAREEGSVRSNQLRGDPRELL